MIPICRQGGQKRALPEVAVHSAVASGEPLEASAGEPLVGRQGPVNAPSMRATRSARACRPRQFGRGSRQSVGNGVYALFQAAALQYHHWHQLCCRPSRNRQSASRSRPETRELQRLPVADRRG